MQAVEFTKDFETKKKGDVAEYDSILARALINKGVARKTVIEIKPKRGRKPKNLDNE